MNNELDCRGMNCPVPVLTVKQTIEATAPVVITVLVDNEAARQNVCRFLEHQGYTVGSGSTADGFRVVGTRGEGADVPAVPAPAARDRSVVPRRIMVLVTSEAMGRGDDGLGEMLMFNFLKTLPEMGPDLWRVAFVNSGVKFTAQGSDGLPILKELADAGVEIAACGVCLAFFHVLETMQVGTVTNMLEIVTGMQLADSVITV
jgi:selenium metabolism protein YedF